MHSVLVTGIGGNVGQGILRVLRSLPYPLHLVGTNTRLPSGGSHLCDAVHQVPWAWSAEYIPELAEVCAGEGVELLIPATDGEAYHLARARDSLPSVAVSPPRTCETFLDKHLTAERLHAANIPFARSSLPTAYKGQFRETVVKPRKGRGSRDVFVNPPSPESFSDEFVVQERHTG